MSKEFDAAAKMLGDKDPMAWVRFLGYPGVSAVVVDSDLNIPMSADRVILVTKEDGSRYLLHIEFEVSWSGDTPHRNFCYHVESGYRHNAPVKTVIFLLRKQANSPRMNGRFEHGDAQYKYRVMRLWETQPERFLGGSLALLPFAPLAKVKKAEMPALLRTMQTQTHAEAGDDEAEWWALVHLLMGLGYPSDQLLDMLKGVFRMLDLKESSTYQSIRAEGRAEGIEQGIEQGIKQGIERGRTEGQRQLLLRTGRKRLGEPDTSVTQAIDEIVSEERLESLMLRLLDVETWEDLLR